MQGVGFAFAGSIFTRGNAEIRLGGEESLGMGRGMMRSGKCSGRGVGRVPNLVAEVDLFAFYP